MHSNSDDQTSEEEWEYPKLTDKPRKRKKNQRKTEVARKKRLSCHETGPDCNCTRLKCFQNVSENERSDLIKQFNSDFKTKDEQDAYLCTLIQVKSVAYHRPRKHQNDAILNENSYVYTVSVSRGDKCEMVHVCYKAFMAIFGITNRRLQTLKKALTATGKNTNIPHKILFYWLCN